MNKLLLWFVVLFGDVDVMFIRNINYTNGVTYDSQYNPNDWHCTKPGCGALLCTVCGSCPRCNPCKHV